MKLYRAAFSTNVERVALALAHKGLLAYDGTPKPAWYVAHDRFTSTPLYVATP